MSKVIPFFEGNTAADLLPLVNSVQRLAMRLTQEGSYAASLSYTALHAPLIQVQRLSVQVSRVPPSDPLSINPIFYSSLSLQEKDALKKLNDMAIFMNSLLDPRPDDAA